MSFSDRPRISANLADLDNRLHALGQPLRQHQATDRFFYKLTESANHSLLWHGLNIVGLVLGRHSRRSAAELAIALGLESALVNGLLKKLFNRQRPIIEAVHPHRLRQPRTTSFPSGHATSAFCAATLLGSKTSRSTRAGLWSLATLVAYSRVHVRIHHATDVIGGAALGLGLGLAFKRLITRVREYESSSQQPTQPETASN